MCSRGAYRRGNAVDADGKARPWLSTATAQSTLPLNPSWDEMTVPTYNGWDGAWVSFISFRCRDLVLTESQIIVARRELSVHTISAKGELEDGRGQRVGVVRTYKWDEGYGE